MHLCRSIVNFFPNFVSIESKMFILRRFFISKFNQAVLNSSYAFIPLIAFLFLESRVWFAVAWLSFVVLVGTNWKIYGSLTVVLHSFFFYSHQRLSNACPLIYHLKSQRVFLTEFSSLKISGKAQSFLLLISYHINILYYIKIYPQMDCISKNIINHLFWTNLK